MLTYDSRIYIAGMTGMVGSNLRDCLARRGYSNVIGGGSKDLNLINQNSVNAFFEKEKPETVVLLAGKVGGILANLSRPAEFIYENLVIEANVIHAAYRVGVKKLIFLASSIVYPRECDQPMAEAQLLSGLLEPTNEPYSVAKIVGIKLCEFYYRSYGANFFTLIPCNLYGPYDHFGREDSHVLAALIHRFHTAKAEKVPSVTLWGSGTVRREFLYSGTTIISYLVMLVSRNYFLLYFFKQKNLLQLILHIVPLAGYVSIIYLVEIFVGNVMIGYAVKIMSFGLFVLLIWFSFAEFRNLFKSSLSGIHQ